MMLDPLFLSTSLLDFCRLLRSLDVIITWEESDLSFWITSIFLVTGIFFLFVPWAFLFRWTGRIAIVVFFGPQNKVLDVMWYSRHETVESRIKKMFSERMIQARCHQEAARKLRDFRSILFGEFSTLVPSIMRTRTLTSPLACSTAQVTTEALPELCFDSVSSNSQLFVPGQTLCGSMVPRPQKEWLRNREESTRSKQTIDQSVLRMEEVKRESQPELNYSSFDDYNAVEEEGVEVSYAMDDEEAGLVPDLFGPPESNLEVGAVEEDDLHSSCSMYDEETGLVPDLLESQESMREIGFEIQWASSREVGVWVDEDDDDSSDEGTEKDGLLEDKDADWKPEESRANMMMEPLAASERRLSNAGVEITELFDDEANFVQQSWRGSSANSI
jgi:hypothetical protein